MKKFLIKHEIWYNHIIFLTFLITNILPISDNWEDKITSENYYTGHVNFYEFSTFAKCVMIYYHTFLCVFLCMSLSRTSIVGASFLYYCSLSVISLIIVFPICLISFETLLMWKLVLPFIIAVALFLSISLFT